MSAIWDILSNFIEGTCGACAIVASILYMATDQQHYLNLFLYFGLIATSISVKRTEIAVRGKK